MAKIKELIYTLRQEYNEQLDATYQEQQAYKAYLDRIAKAALSKELTL